MLIINRDSVDKLRKRLSNPEAIEQCKDELKRMLEIKEASLWRAEGGFCCGSFESIKDCLVGEVQLLEKALVALEQGNIAEASVLLESYAGQMQ